MIGYGFHYALLAFFSIGLPTRRACTAFKHLSLLSLSLSHWAIFCLPQGSYLVTPTIFLSLSCAMIFLKENLCLLCVTLLSISCPTENYFVCSVQHFFFCFLDLAKLFLCLLSTTVFLVTSAQPFPDLHITIFMCTNICLCLSCAYLLGSLHFF